jgi:hypothetical protein
LGERLWDRNHDDDALSRCGQHAGPAQHCPIGLDRPQGSDHALLKFDKILEAYEHSAMRPTVGALKAIEAD